MEDHDHFDEILRAEELALPAAAVSYAVFCGAGVVLFLWLGEIVSGGAVG